MLSWIPTLVSTAMKLIRVGAWWFLAFVGLLTTARGQPGQVLAWGQYYNGSTFVPVFVPDNLTNVTALGGGAGHSLALRRDGTVVSWGYNYYGQTNVPPGLSNVVAIASGKYFSLALRADGTIAGWGQYYDGTAFVPMNPAALAYVVAVASGAGHGLALRGNGTVTAWGSNTYGQTNVPANLGNVMAIAAGEYCSFALRADGGVIGWGKYDNGSAFVPVFVPPGLSNVIAVAAGAGHTVALRRDGTVVAWGFNNYGQTNVPPGLSNVVAISAGLLHTVVWKSDGTLTAWGYNLNGQTNIPASATNTAAIVAANYHNLALVSAAPGIVSSPLGSIELSEGAQTNLTVSVRAATDFSSQWFFNGWPVAGAAGTDLLITNFSLSQAGVYSVSVSNEDGGMTAQVAVVRLTNSPVILVDGIDVGGGGVTRVDSARIIMSSTLGADAPIYYTLDGSDPDFTAIPYTGMFTLTNSAAIRAIAYDGRHTNWAEAAPIQVGILATYPFVATTAGGGTVTAYPPPYSGANRYLSNAVVTLAATAADGWSFMNWTGDSTDTTNVTTILMNGPKAVQGVFGTSLAVFQNGNGRMSIDPPAGPYAFGSTVRLTAVPASGSFFFGWAGPLSGFDNPLSIQMTRPLTITALFGLLRTNQVSLTVLPAGNGLVIITPDTNVYRLGDGVTLTAVPATNYLFTGWSGDVTSATNPLNLTLSSSMLITANFAYFMPTNPPVITAQPSSRTLSAGSETVLTIQASADGPLSYQWCFNGVPIAGATNADLRLTNFGANAAGLYDVVVTGPAGTATSAAASVALFGMELAAAGAQQLPLLMLDAAGGTHYRIEVREDLGAGNWSLLVMLNPQGSTVFYIDDPATNHIQRYYRAVPQ